MLNMAYWYIVYYISSHLLFYNGLKLIVIFFIKNKGNGIVL